MAAPPVSDVQREIIGALKARLDNSLVADSEIREADWHGTQWGYPNVRVSRASFQPDGNGNCSDRRWRVNFQVTAFSKKDSSVNVQEIQNQIAAALEGYQLQGITATVGSLPVRLMMMAAPDPIGDNWQGPVRFTTILWRR